MRYVICIAQEVPKLGIFLPGDNKKQRMGLPCSVRGAAESARESDRHTGHRLNTTKKSESVKKKEMQRLRIRTSMPWRKRQRPGNKPFGILVLGHAAHEQSTRSQSIETLTGCRERRPHSSDGRLPRKLFASTRSSFKFVRAASSGGIEPLKEFPCSNR